MPPTFSTTTTRSKAAMTFATMAASASFSTKSPLGNSAWASWYVRFSVQRPLWFSIVSKALLRSQPSLENRLMEMIAVSAKAAARRTSASGTSGSSTTPGERPSA